MVVEYYGVVHGLARIGVALRGPARLGTARHGARLGGELPGLVFCGSSVVNAGEVMQALDSRNYAIGESQSDWMIELVKQSVHHAVREFQLGGLEVPNSSEYY